MISKNQLKLIRALGQKKQRKQQGLYLVQGEKNVLELVKSAQTIRHIFATEAFLSQHADELAGLACVAADEETLTRVSTLVSNNAAIAVVEIPKQAEVARQNAMLALDGVSDPGNLGTIIRLADWYGYRQLLLSRDCADPYSPKTISATMGSFARVDTIVLDLPDFLATLEQPVYGAFLEGENVHHTRFAPNGVLLMGSESHGIRPECARFVTDKITIPAFGGAESLNVAMATGIILDNIRRND